MPQDSKQWYVIYTAPRAEKQVSQRLASALHVSDVFLPLHLAPRIWSDRVKMVEVPLFSSYIFVQCLEIDLRSLLKIYGVIRIVYYDGKPAVIRDQEIESIKKFLELSATKELCQGDDVYILCGSFKQQSGKVIKINKKYLVLMIDQIGATISVKLDTVVKAK